jgi:hypothetical protein
MEASKTQLDVLSAVKLLPGCTGAASELPSDDGLFSIDIALVSPDGRKVAIEVDGPTHFLTNAPQMVNGNTALRNQLLEARGWTVVSLPAVVWSRVALARKDANERPRFLTQLMSAHGIQL